MNTKEIYAPTSMLEASRRKELSRRQRVESRILSRHEGVYRRPNDGCLCRRKRGGEVIMPVSHFQGLRRTMVSKAQGHAETSVEGKETLGASSRLLKTNEQTVEGFFPSQHPKQGAFERSPEDTRSSDSLLPQDNQTPCSQRRTCRNPASGCNREHNLDRILEGQMKACVGKKQPDAICEVDSPEGRGDLLAVNAREAIPDAGVARHLSFPDLWNGILGLK